MAMTPNPNLPEELLIEIFLRLPSKSIGKFRSLSKPWRALLSSPKFIKSHHTRETHQQNLILISQFGALHTISTIDRNYEAVSKKLNLSNTWSAVVGSCNGLVLLLNKKGNMTLVNPITQEQVNIPDSPLSLPKTNSYSMHGFGYDGCNDDYKILTLSYYEADGVETFVDVYSMKWGVWKRVNSSSYDHTVPLLRPGAFVNGVIHWLASSRESDGPSFIVAFDFVEEVFYEIPGPLGVDMDSLVFNELFVLGESLCIFDYGNRSYTPEFWMLKEYGKVESWTKFIIDVEWDIIKPLCFIGDEEVVLLTREESLVVYNVKEGCSKTMVVDEVRTMFLDGSTFWDSLVSPTFGNEVEGKQPCLIKVAPEVKSRRNKHQGRISCSN